MPQCLCGESFTGDTDDEKISCHSLNNRRQRGGDLRAKQQLEHDITFKPHAYRRAKADWVAKDGEEVF
jgi:hypothetical protein